MYVTVYAIKKSNLILEFVLPVHRFDDYSDRKLHLEEYF